MLTIIVGGTMEENSRRFLPLCACSWPGRQEELWPASHQPEPRQGGTRKREKVAEGHRPSSAFEAPSPSSPWPTSWPRPGCCPPPPPSPHWSLCLPRQGSTGGTPCRPPRLLCQRREVCEQVCEQREQQSLAWRRCFDERRVTDWVGQTQPAYVMATPPPPDLSEERAPRCCRSLPLPKSTIRYPVPKSTIHLHTRLPDVTLSSCTNPRAARMLQLHLWYT